MDYNLQIVVILTVGFAFAGLLGYIAQRLKLPSILGYLLAGYLIGPYSPGFVANMQISEQLAEIGVILMLFGVGLHFKLEDLINVKNIAIPGAIGQTLVAAIVGTFLVYSIGWPIEAGIIIGLAIGVASTVVLVRVLSDNNLLETPQGHIAVGWLIVEDIITVAVLILLPMLSAFQAGSQLSFFMIISAILFMVAKFILLAVVMFTWGHKIVAYLMMKIARLRSNELFTIALLALTFLIATGSAFVFGTSIALGAFIAGMIIGRTDVRHQALANALPLKDVFAVIFFLSVGMLFDPKTIIEHFTLFIGILAIILLVKPLTALLITLGLKYSMQVALIVALSLAQIGEFSFILAEEAMNLNLLPEAGYDVLVACALISISINPLLFRGIDLKGRLTSVRPLHAKILKESPGKIYKLFETQRASLLKVIIVGFGPIGQAVSDVLERVNIKPMIIEQNIDTVSEIKDNTDRQIIFGDATSPNILELTEINLAHFLIITVPNIETTKSIIKSAQQLNPNIRILARIRFLADQTLMEEMNVDFICCEQETRKAFKDRVANLIKAPKKK